MLIECDQIALDVDLWAKAQVGDETARQIIRKKLHGLDIYMHALSTAPGENLELVSLRQLEDYGLIESVKISTQRDPDKKMKNHLEMLPEYLRRFVVSDGGIHNRPTVFYENTPNREYIELVGSFGYEDLEQMAAYIRATQQIED